MAHPLLYYFAGIFMLYTVSTVPQTDNISQKRKLAIFLYIAFVTLIFSSIGQGTTLIALIGINILLTIRLSYKLQNLIGFYLGYLLTVCIDYLSSILLNLFFDMTFQDITNILPFYLLCYLPVIYISSRLLRYFLHQKLNIQTISVDSKLLTGFLINLTITIIIFVFGIVYGEHLGYPPSIILFNGILFSAYFMLSNILFYFTYHTAKKDEQLKNQLIQYENLDAYTKEVERLYHNMRAFKHDYLDILASLKGYIDESSHEALAKYFYETILPFNKSILDADSKLGQLSNIKMDSVKSLLSSKLLVAIEKGLHVSLEVTKPIETFPMEQLDLIRVLGIILNNATEAALTSLQKELALALIQDTGKTIILLRNSTDVIPIPLGEICKNGKTTKQSHSGIGLYHASQILDTYENIRWRMDYKIPIFMMEITLFDTTERKKK